MTAVPKKGTGSSTVAVTLGCGGEKLGATERRDRGEKNGGKKLNQKPHSAAITTCDETDEQTAQQVQQVCLIG